MSWDLVLKIHVNPIVFSKQQEACYLKYVTAGHFHKVGKRSASSVLVPHKLIFNMLQFPKVEND